MPAPSRRRRFLPLLLAVGLGVQPTAASGNQAQTIAAGPTAESEAAVCDRKVALIETEYAIPTGLLRAISIVESGYTVPGTKKRVSWAWAASIDGRSFYFRSKAEAVRRISAALAAGSAVDAGCMQINLSRWHPIGEAFPDVDSALDPDSNIRYGAALLLRFKEQYGDWTNAVGFYNGSSYTTRLAYVCRVAREHARLINAAVSETCAALARDKPVPHISSGSAI